MAGLSAVNCGGVTSLAPAASVTCTATYTTTQADVDAGAVTNTGTATGTPPTGANVSDTSIGDRAGATRLRPSRWSKTAVESSFSLPGTVVTYSYQVTNTGNVTLTNLSVTDPMTGLSAISCGGVTTLAPAHQHHLHRHLHHHPGRRRRRIHQQHRHRHRHPTQRPRRPPQPVVGVVRPARPAPSLFPRQRPRPLRRPGRPVTYSYKVTNTGNVTAHRRAASPTPMTGLRPGCCGGPTCLARPWVPVPTPRAPPPTRSRRPTSTTGRSRLGHRYRHPAERRHPHVDPATAAVPSRPEPRLSP